MKVKCRYCFEEQKLVNLKRHVQNIHPDFFLKKGNKGRKYFVAMTGQSQPDDPAWRPDKTDRDHLDELSQLHGSQSKRPKHDENEVDFAVLFKQQVPEDADELDMYDSLIILLDHFPSQSAVRFFRSSDMRQSKSQGRLLIESARRWAKELKEDQLAKVLFAAIIIGGSTLNQFCQVLLEQEKNRRKRISQSLDLALRHSLKFDQDFANWVSFNLHRLNDSSVTLLEDLDTESYKYVRIATVTKFDHTNSQELNKYKSRARIIYQGFSVEKVVMIEEAASKTNDSLIKLDLKQLSQLIIVARDLPNKMSRSEQERFKSLTLDKWEKEAKKESQVQELEDKGNLVAAFVSIAERHKDLKGKQELVQEYGRGPIKVFEESYTELNHLQCATACLAFANSEKVPAQIWVVPAGQGKSRIHAALTFLFLDRTDYDIHVVFQHDGLKKIDQERNKRLQMFCDGSQRKWSGRVHYQTDLKRRKNSTKKAVMIVDESDEIMFRDLLEFYKSTKHERIMTICLTATAYEGQEGGLEQAVLDEMGYKIYKNSDKSDNDTPVVHEYRSFKSVDDYRSLISQEKDKKGVLVYANGTEYESLANEDFITPVTPDTSYLALEQMDVKFGLNYPVYLINEKYGNRGLNFRAPSNGITMLILGTFTDPRTRIQTLFRVGRFGDPCTRIQDPKFDDFDKDYNSQRKGKIESVLNKIRLSKAKDANLGKTSTKSPTEFADQHLTNGDYLIKQQQETLEEINVGQKKTL